MTQPKICKDCIHFKLQQRPLGSMCAHPSNLSINLVSGVWVPTFRPTVMREYEHLCGPGGSLYVAKPVYVDIPPLPRKAPKPSLWQRITKVTK